MAINPCMRIEVAVMGPIENNVYVIDDGEAVFVVDPTEGASYLAEIVGERRCAAIVLTHAHWDHVGAAKELRDLTGAPVIASALDAPVIDGSAMSGSGHRRFEPCPVDQVVEDGQRVTIGASTWTVMVTPGHTPGSMCLFVDAADADNGHLSGTPVLVAGDTLFAGAHGRTDFEGGDPQAMAASLVRLAELPDDTLVLPGHNDVTTIAREKLWIQ